MIVKLIDLKIFHPYPFTTLVMDFLASLECNEIMHNKILFSGEFVMNKNQSLNGEDIVILQTMLENYPMKGNLDRLVTGGLFFPISSSAEIDHKKIISKLLNLGLIRENVPSEYLTYFTKSDLIVLLEKYNVKKSSGKNILIEEAIKFLTEDEIASYKSYKTFCVVSEEGKQVLEKHKNIVWFIEQEGFIFGYGKTNAVYNIHYFFNHPDIEPLNEMIEYYSTKDPEIAGKLHYLKGDYVSAIRYIIQFCTLSLSREVKKCLNNKFNLDFFGLSRTVRNEKWIIDSYIQISNYGNLDISSIIELNYESHFEHKGVINKDLFIKTVYAFIKEERGELDKLTDQYKEQIKNTYTKDSDPKEELLNTSFETYLAQEAAKEVALLDLLIEHLDIEMLEALRTRVELKISEYEFDEDDQ